MTVDGRCEGERSREDVPFSCILGDRTADDRQKYQETKKAKEICYFCRSFFPLFFTHYNDACGKLESLDGDDLY